MVAHWSDHCKPRLAVRSPSACVVAALVCITTRAVAGPAELALGEQNLQLLPRAKIWDDHPHDPYVRMSGFAQVVGGGEGGGDLGVGGALGIAGVGCDLVDAAVQGRLRPFADSVIVGDGRYSICLSRLFLTVVFDGRRGVGLAPALSARSSLWRRRYAASYDRLTAGFGEAFGDDESRRHSILMMAIGHGTTTQTDAMETRTIKELDVTVDVYRYHVLGNVETTLDVISFTANAMKAGSTNEGGVASAFYPAQLRIETAHVFGSARAGWGMTGGQLTVSSKTEANGETVSEWSETIDGAGLPSLTMGVGDATLGMRLGSVEASATIARTVFPTFDGNLARESRASGTATVQIAKLVGTPQRPLALSISPFVARTRTWKRDEGTARDASYGATVQLGRELSKLLRVDAIGELGRSPYARLGDGERAPTSTFGGQLLVALSARMQR